MTHAETMSPARFQRTEESRLLAPAPSTAPVTVWVVDTGNPKCPATCRIDALATEAENPCMGDIFATLPPSVLMIFQPPAYVPRPIAMAAESFTHSGGSV